MKESEEGHTRSLLYDWFYTLGCFKEIDFNILYVSIVTLLLRDHSENITGGGGF